MGRILTQDASASCLTVLDAVMRPEIGSAGEGPWPSRNARRRIGRAATAVWPSSVAGHIWHCARRIYLPNPWPNSSRKNPWSFPHVIPPSMLSVIRDQGPCDLWGLSTNAGLAALYDRELGHLMIWPPEHRYRWAGGGCTGWRDQRREILSRVKAVIRWPGHAWLSVRCSPFPGLWHHHLYRCCWWLRCLSRQLSRGELRQSLVRRGLQQRLERPSLSGRKRRAQVGAREWPSG